MCTVSCPSGACPAGLTCGSDGFCHKTPGERCDLTDASGDGAGGRDASFCYGSGFVHVCLASAPQNTVSYVSTTVDTNDAACDILKLQDDSSKLCIYVGATITFTGNVRITGPNPVVFLGASAVTVNAGSTVDVASHAATPSSSPAGVASAICGTNLGMNGQTDPNAGGGGGGAGGTLRTSGGDGGAGASGMSVSSGGAPGLQLPSLTTVRAGCPGGSGGNGAASSGGLGGKGGGAVYLMSGSIVRVFGQINASGAGGGRPTATGGGGGGGTGGFIGLDAPTYEIMGSAIFAVGGSGAAGAVTTMAGIVGNEATGPSSPGSTSTTTTAGSGGAGGATGAGGNGTLASLGGGGGGGGSTGFIGIANLPAVIPPSTFAPLPVSMN